MDKRGIFISHITEEQAAALSHTSAERYPPIQVGVEPWATDGQILAVLG
jgi:hypothetical protein